ncbi:MAG: PKD domain-containing protein, partial [Bacteroidota bacterium]|nr:PKD domain-containing protein [Bacteroidota bacterium]
MGKQLLPFSGLRGSIFLMLLFMGLSGLENRVAAQTAAFTVASTTGNCSPATLNFTDTSTGATSWLWDFGDSNASTAQSPSKLFSSPGTYTVTLTINGGGSPELVATQQVPVYPAPQPTIPLSVQGCAPFSGSLTAVCPPVTIASYSINSSLVGGITGGNVTGYKWEFSGSLATQLTSTPVCNLTNVPAGTYDVTLTATDEFGCSGSIFKPGAIVVSTTPAINDLSTSICSNSTFHVTPANITDGVVPSGTTYSWIAPSGSGFTGGDASSGSPTGIAGTLVNVTDAPVQAVYTVTPASGNCTGPAFNVTVTVNPTPSVSATPTSQTICSGSTSNIGLSTTITGATVTYSWTAALSSGTATGFTDGSGSTIAQTLINTTNSPAVVRYTITPA